MTRSPIISSTPLPVIRALKKIGHDIRDARRRRRIPVAILAERASISRTTLNKVENGDFGIYATVLFSLGFINRLSDLVDVRHDTLGLELEEEHLPKRIRFSNKKPGKPQDTQIP